MEEFKEYKILKKDEGKRIDLLIMSLRPNLTRTSIKNLLKKEAFYLKNEPEKFLFANYRVKEGDILSVKDGEINKIFNSQKSFIKKIKIDFEILYEDSYTLVINKPSGFPTHPNPGSKIPSILNGLYYYFSKTNKTILPRLIHRLDIETSGVLLVAKTLEAQQFYSNLFENRLMEKEYIAVVMGDFEAELIKSRSDSINVTSNLFKSEKDKKVITINSPNKGLYSRTVFFFDKHFNKFGKKKFSVVKCFPKTGRTHQIRVHLSNLGYPILGDKTYNGQKYKRVMLHSYKLTFPLYKNRTSKKKSSFIAELPKEFISE